MKNTTVNPVTSANHTGAATHDRYTNEPQQSLISTLALPNLDQLQADLSKLQALGEKFLAQCTPEQKAALENLAEGVTKAAKVPFYRNNPEALGMALENMFTLDREDGPNAKNNDHGAKRFQILQKMCIKHGCPLSEAQLANSDILQNTLLTVHQRPGFAFLLKKKERGIRKKLLTEGYEDALGLTPEQAAIAKHYALAGMKSDEISTQNLLKSLQPLYKDSTKTFENFTNGHNFMTVITGVMILGALISGNHGGTKIIMGSLIVSSLFFGLHGISKYFKSKDISNAARKVLEEHSIKDVTIEELLFSFENTIQLPEGYIGQIKELYPQEYGDIIEKILITMIKPIIPYSMSLSSYHWLLEEQDDTTSDPSLAHQMIYDQKFKEYLAGHSHNPLGEISKIDKLDLKKKPKEEAVETILAHYRVTFSESITEDKRYLDRVQEKEQSELLINSPEKLQGIPYLKEQVRIRDEKVQELLLDLISITETPLSSDTNTTLDEVNGLADIDSNYAHEVVMGLTAGTLQQHSNSINEKIRELKKLLRQGNLRTLLGEQMTLALEKSYHINTDTENNASAILEDNTGMPEFMNTFSKTQKNNDKDNTTNNRIRS